ncbi:MAG: hypothetical protein AAGF30_00315 [Pseudomonadota bacterium]
MPSINKPVVVTGRPGSALEGPRILLPKGEALAIDLDVRDITGAVPEGLASGYAAFTLATSEKGDPDHAWDTDSERVTLVDVSFGRYRFDLTPDDLANLSEGSEYHYNFWARTETGDRSRQAFGVLASLASIEPEWPPLASLAEITGGPPVMPDPVLAGRTYAAVRDDVADPAYEVVGNPGAAVTIVERRMVSGGVVVTDLAALIPIGAEVAAEDVVSAPDAASDPIRGAARTAVAATINVTEDPSLPALAPGLPKAEVIALVDPGLAAANNGQVVNFGTPVLTLNGGAYDNAHILADGDVIAGTADYTATGATPVNRPIAAVTVQAAFGLSETAQATFQINNATGEVTATFTEPPKAATYDAGNGAGIFTFQTDDLGAGPVNFVPPPVEDDGTPDVGETLTAVDGVWVNDVSLAEPILSYQWQRDGVDIPGADQATYTLQPADAGAVITVVETATDANGARSVSSAPVSVPAAAGSAPSFVTSAASSPRLDATESETYAISGAGNRIIVIADIGNAGFTATMSNGDTVTKLAEHIAGSGQVGVTWFYVEATGAANLTYTAIGDSSFEREIYEYLANNASSTIRDDAPGEASSVDPSVTLTGLVAGDHVLACLVDRDDQSDPFALVWGDDLTGDGDAARLMASAHGSAVASDVASGASFTGSASNTGITGGVINTILSAIALEAS